MKKPLALQVVFSAKFAFGERNWLCQLNLLRKRNCLTAAIGEFNIAFCDSRKYHNPEGIISHFALAKYFTKYNFQGTEAGVFFAFSFSIEKFDFL